MGNLKAYLIIIVMFFMALMIYIAETSDKKKNKEMWNAEKAIEYCWQEQSRKSFTDEQKRGMAMVCEKLEDDYKNKYGRKP